MSTNDTTPRAPLPADATPLSAEEREHPPVYSVHSGNSHERGGAGFRACPLSFVQRYEATVRRVEQELATERQHRLEDNEALQEEAAKRVAAEQRVRDLEWH